MSFLDTLKQKIRCRTAPEDDLKTRRDRVLRECGNICYCPGCKDILNDQATISLDETYYPGQTLVRYRCKCGHLSLWNFASPVPLLITHIPPVPPNMCDVCNIRTAIGKTGDATNICSECALTNGRGYVTYETLGLINSQKKEKQHESK